MPTNYFYELRPMRTPKGTYWHTHPFCPPSPHCFGSRSPWRVVEGLKLLCTQYQIVAGPIVSNVDDHFKSRGHKEGEKAELNLCGPSFFPRPEERISHSNTNSSTNSNSNSSSIAVISQTTSNGNQ